MDTDIADSLIKIGLALLLGFVIGTEREYKNKVAGLRTLTLICVGSTLFTMLSTELGAESETGRIASNIVTGIGFLGAGAILREGLNVSGLTTASSIWATAAIGMAVGAGEYWLSVITALVVLAVLTLFGFVQPLIERFRKAIELHITCAGGTDPDRLIEQDMDRYRLTYYRARTIKKDGDTVLHYDVSGPKDQLNLFLKSLNQNSAIKSFEY